MRVTTSKSKNAESFYISKGYINDKGVSTSVIVRKLGTLKELLLEPSRKRSSYAVASVFPEKPSYQLHDIYRAWDVFGNIYECNSMLVCIHTPFKISHQITKVIYGLLYYPTGMLGIFCFLTFTSNGYKNQKSYKRNIPPNFNMFEPLGASFEIWRLLYF